MGKFVAFIAGAVVGFITKEIFVSVVVHEARKDDEKFQKILDNYDNVGVAIENALTKTKE